MTDHRIAHSSAEKGPSTRVTYESTAQFRRTMLLTLAGVLFIALAGVTTEPARMWPNILLAGYYLIGVGVSAALFLALASVTNAGWTAAIRRIPEALSLNILFGGGVMIVMLLGIHEIYEWSHAEVVAADPLLQAKSSWLNVPGFVSRTLVYVALWGGGAWMVVRALRRQDADPTSDHTPFIRKVSGFFIVVVALTYWLASMDWLMSIEPHWYSTIFGLYNLSGSFLAGLAVITVTAITLRRRGWLEGVLRQEHLHDLGKLLFAFSTFWMYIWFSQYILIWYANIPEETVYYLRRETAGWGTFTLLNVGFNWVIPFVFLLPARWKRHEGLLLRVCFVILLGHWVDLFLMIFPTSMPETPTVHIWELSAVVAVTILLYVSVVVGLRRVSLIPREDPYLSESMSYSS